ncbi:MAG: hypothetical protein GY822_22985 [Deltaproteobacteria bacterium]|nr:hypothetical protein [Deltaproteobacteria bacterium]
MKSLALDKDVENRFNSGNPWKLVEESPFTMGGCGDRLKMPQIMPTKGEHYFSAERISGRATAIFSISF